MLPAAISVNCITACNRFIFEKLRIPQLVKEFPAFYGNLKFNTTLDRAQYLCLL